MQLPHTVEKSALAAENPGGQQMGLGAKGRRLQLRIQAFAHHPPHVFLHQLQVAKQDPFPLTATFRMLRNLLHPGQHFVRMPVLNHLPH
jgi:hypothetical protein